jgi:hypothetical protein
MNDDNRKQRSNTDGRDDKGRFGPGNPGRPVGSRNHVNQMAEAVIEDNLGKIAEKCVELALEGNTACLLALLKLRVPALRQGSVQEPIDLPALEMPKDAMAALRIIAEALANADVDGGHARSLVVSIEGYLKTFQVVNFDERLRALEAIQAKEDRHDKAA